MKYKKESTEKKCQDFEQFIQEFKTETKDTFEFVRLNYGQYRVTTPYKRIDFFLRGKRYHDITNQIRGAFEDFQDCALLI